MDQTGSFNASVGPVGTQPADGLAGDTADRFEQRDETLRLALDAARLGVWDYDMQAGSCLLSATAAELLGRPAARMQGRLADWLARVHPADRERFALAFDAALRDGADFKAEYRTLPVVDGGLPAPPRWLHSHGRVLRDAGGRPSRLVGISRDITARHERTAELAGREARFRTLAEAVPGLLFVADAAGMNTFTNRRFQDYAGLPAEALLGEGWAGTLHPEDAPRARAVWEAAVRHGMPYEVEFRIRRGADGDHRWHLARGLPIPAAERDGKAGVPEAWVGVCIDIEDIVRVREATARRGADLERTVAERTAALAQSEAEARLLYNRAPAPMHSVGPDGRLLQVSDEWVRFLGHPREDAVGRHLSDFMDEDSHQRYRTLDWPRMQGAADGVREAEYRVRRQAGDWVEVLLRARPEHDPEGRFVRSLAVLVDVTARNRAEGQLRQAQKIEALGELTGGVAHDFNNLLQVVSGALRLLERHLPQGPDGETARRLLAAATDGAGRGARLTQQLLAFARRGRLEPEPVEVNARIAAFADGLLQRALGTRAELRLELQAGLWPALVDPTQLEVALLNLAVNARDAMPEDGRRGTLALETANIRLGPGDRLMGDGPTGGRGAAQSGGDDGPLPAGDYVLVAVTDSGAGMDQATLTRATEPFFTTKDVGKGTGLGLSQVYGFARQSGGAVRIQSHPGQGTTVHLYLPRAMVTGPALAAAPALAKMAEASGTME